MIKGIDISNNNYYHLANMGFYPLLRKDQFVIMKATEGRTYKDNKVDFYYNLVHESDDGRPDPDRLYGFYHYARPENNSPETEVVNFLRVCGHHAGYAVFALDVEGTALTLPISYLDDWVYQWVLFFEAETGVIPLIYCSASATGRFKKAAMNNCGLWVASWNKKPTKTMIKPWNLWALWQDSTSSGVLDTDVFNGTPEQFRMYGKQS